MSSKDVLAQLKSAIGRQMPHAPSGTGSPTASPAVKPAEPTTRKNAVRKPAAEPAAHATMPRSGKGVQFYLEDGDRKIINNLAVWFGSQDRRVSDSQVIKAAIRLANAQQGQKLLDICDAVRGTDRRRQQKTRPERAGK